MHLQAKEHEKLLGNHQNQEEGGKDFSSFWFQGKGGAADTLISDFLP